jgi:hypothetical protein
MSTATEKGRRSFNRRIWNPRELRDYLLQVTLIILSILIATSVDRCNQAQKNARDLQEYLLAVRADLIADIESNNLNLIDCKKDVAGISRGLALLRHNHPDSLDQAIIGEIVPVLNRGVFRSFPPTTFELMQATGDVRLIPDLELRDLIATAFAFQEDYVKADLQAYDAQVLATIEQLGRFIDLTCVLQPKRATACIEDQPAFLSDPHNELVLLLRVADNRAFHLERATYGLKKTLEAVEEVLAQ